MKGSSMDTHIGKITIDKDVVSKYAGSVAVECFGIVGMAGVNVKDGLVKLLKRESITRGIVVKVVNNKLVLDIHTRLRLGCTTLPDFVLGCYYFFTIYTGIAAFVNKCYDTCLQ